MKSKDKLFRNNLVELIMILNIILLTLAEKAFLLAPVIIYFIILTNIMVLILTLLISKLFNKEITEIYSKTLFYSLILIFGILLISSVFATFLMPQAKNKGLLVFLWVATIISIPNSFTFNSSKTKDFKLIKFLLKNENNN